MAEAPLAALGSSVHSLPVNRGMHDTLTQSQLSRITFTCLMGTNYTGIQSPVLPAGMIFRLGFSGPSEFLVLDVCAAKVPFRSHSMSGQPSVNGRA